MKVITEEVFNEVISGLSDYDWKAANEMLQLFRHRFQELDTLTVTRLRPMSEAQEGDILVKWIRENGLRGAFYVDGWVYINGGNYKPEEFEGWVPMPIYEPEKS